MTLSKNDDSSILNPEPKKFDIDSSATFELEELRNHAKSGSKGNYATLSHPESNQNEPHMLSSPKAGDVLSSKNTMASPQNEPNYYQKVMMAQNMGDMAKYLNKNDAQPLGQSSKIPEYNRYVNNSSKFSHKKRPEFNTIQAYENRASCSRPKSHDKVESKKRKRSKRRRYDTKRTDNQSSSGIKGRTIRTTSQNAYKHFQLDSSDSRVVYDSSIPDINCNNVASKSNGFNKYMYNSNDSGNGNNGDVYYETAKPDVRQPQQQPSYKQYEKFSFMRPNSQSQRQYTLHQGANPQVNNYQAKPRPLVEYNGMC